MNMHVLVVLRLVPDTDEDFELGEDGKSIDREWIGFKLNEFDDHALEEGVLLKEASGAKVTAVALDGEGVDRLLQTALARGADSVAKIPHDLTDPIPAPVVAQMIAAFASQNRCDLILTGVQTVEDLFGQLAPALGAVLDWPQVSAVSALKAEATHVVVQQEYSGGYSAALSVALPAVVGIQAASKPPRYVSGSKLRDVLGAKIPTVDIDVDIDAKLGEVESLGFQESSGHAEMIEGKAEAVAARLVAILRERGFAKG
jgi:electron transfer flavoprotein beta subunit